MGKAFVPRGRVAVTDENGNTIWIRERMNFAQTQEVTDAANQIMRAAGATEMTAEFEVGAWNTAIAKVNILGWDGPDFDGIEFSADQIDQFDPAFPLFEKAMVDIGERNKRIGQVATDPKAAPDELPSGKTKS